MARVQANDAAHDSPLAINLSKLQTSAATATSNTALARTTTPVLAGGASDLYAATLRAGFGMQNIDQNGQAAKEDFFNADLKKLGYLPNKVVTPRPLTN
ncbi:hypothetical protein [Bradyrhizobium diazoefficiens]|uniref:hypothetical protein n=1 Tax=Bradyrhizobium diazoefficiens TaxID=1355477 RepID=UPI001FEFA064|nr:hypothetical protein [Bradyrhizobium diazoefficiens]